MAEQGDRYLRAWRALGRILRDGGSWSGHERNCCFLNTRSHRFADVSSVAGFDHDADSRGLALVDWDQDGDLDVWTSNRSAPRVRFLENQHASRNRFLAIRLQGMKCNRDAIGARLELTTVTELGPDSVERTHIQTLRAGEGYLAQSSKWVHFGLGEDRPLRLVVRWPGGDEQTFDDLQANSRYKVVEGETELQLVESNRKVEFANVEVPKAKSTPDLRIVSSRRLPVPQLRVIDSHGKAETVNFNASKYTLLMLWATWCQPCVAELQEFQQQQAVVSAKGVRWLPLNVDGVSESKTAERLATSSKFLGKLQASFENKLATRPAVECLDVMQRSLTSKQDSLPVPCSFLVDGNGSLVAVYKGALGVEQLLRDVERFEQPSADPRDHALPFPGSFAMNTFEADLMAVASSLIEIGRADEALSYMLTHIPNQDFPPPITKASLVGTYLELGRAFMGKRELDKAERAALQALKVDPESGTTRLALGELYLMKGRKSEAVKYYREVLGRSPGQPMALNNLSWILATSQDESLRSPQEAVEFAERLCSITNFGEPISLDTYSVALASDGQFDRAIELLKSAIELAQKVGKSTERMEARLQLFEAGKSYRE